MAAIKVSDQRERERYYYLLSSASAGFPATACASAATGLFFTMPQGNFYVWIYFSYTPEVAETEKYCIDYNTLGNGSVLSVDMDCPSYAVAGETVTFTLTLVDLSGVFEDYKPLSITNVVLQYQDTGEDFYGFGQSGEGSYTFVTPDADVTIMIYLMYE